jgi:hypothetical protein
MIDILLFSLATSHSTPALTQFLLQLVAPLVALAIALGSNFRDNRKRREDTKARKDDSAQQAAWKILWTHGPGRTDNPSQGHFIIENESDRPIVDIVVTRGWIQFDLDGVIEWWPDVQGVPWHSPLLLPSRSVEVSGHWYEEGKKATEGSQGSPAYPPQDRWDLANLEFTWRDPDGRHWRAAAGSVRGRNGVSPGPWAQPEA